MTVSPLLLWLFGRGEGVGGEVHFVAAGPAAAVASVLAAVKIIALCQHSERSNFTRSVH